MKKIFIKIIFLLVVSIMIIPASAILPTQTKDEKYSSLNQKNSTGNSIANNWWPMYRKDSGNTGCSTSISPFTNHIKWKHTIPENLYATTPIVSADRLYISTNWYFYSEKTNLTKSGILQPSSSLPDLRQMIMNHPTGEATGLYCLNAITGEQIWFYPLYSPNDPAIFNEKLYIVDLGTSYMSTLYCLNPTTGELIWEKTIGQMVLSPTIIADEKIFLAGFDIYGYSGSMNCYDLSGNNLWSYPLPANELIWFSAPAVNDGIVSFISTNFYSYYEGHIYALDEDNGGYLWSHTISSLFLLYFGLPSAVCTNGRVYAIDINIYSYFGYLKCFDSETGSPIWTTMLGPILSCSTPTIDGDSIFITGIDMNSYYSLLYKIYVENGTIQWIVPIPSVSFYLGNTICSENAIILFPGSYYGESNQVFCFNKGDGMSLWQFYLDDITIGNPSIGDKLVYLVDYSGNVYAISERLAGGFMNVKMILQNTGDTSLTNISWTISVEGGLGGSINRTKSGNIKTLSAGKFNIVRMFPIFGLGKVYVSATATMEGMNVLEIKKQGMALGPIIILGS
jgi:outer membrane protein assembly factor BamB